MVERTEIEQQVRNLLEEILSNTTNALDISTEGGLRAAGVPSASLVALLVQMEEAFGFEWDDYTPPEVFRSISTLAAFVSSHEQPIKEPR
jgi:acyl carrier protein